jgi:hypothetical protein
MKRLALIILISIATYTIMAQNSNMLKKIVLPTPNMASSERTQFSNICGIIQEMNFNCLDDEFAQKKDNVWRKYIKVQSIGAEEIKIIFRKFILSTNAIVSFYTDDSLRYRHQGVYFVQKPDSSFISDFLHGDYCTIIIEIPMNELDKNQILISQIYHFTESFEDALKSAEADYSCMIDINCSEGNSWCDQKRSVALYYYPTSDGLIGRCSGALVNNYRNDFAQYFLTARHCTNEVTDWNTTTFYFNYQNTFCNSNDVSNHYGVQGSQLIGYCDVSWSDNALLLITEPIPIQYNVYYSGVDIAKRSAGDEVTCIHHSMGKPKKIVSGHIQHFAGPKWEVYWDNGIIRGGGSGAPVFLNSNKRIIATISGGFQNLDCGNSLKQEWVGKVRACMPHSGNMQSALFGESDYVSYGGIDPIKSCQSTLNLGGDFYPTTEYDATLNGLTIQAANTIISNATFHSGSNYTLTAGDRIVFQQGTKIEVGAKISAKISPCPENLVSCGTHTSKNKSFGNFSKEDENIVTEDIQQDIVSLYPNPNEGTFAVNINFDPQEIITIQVFNSLGISVYQQVGLPNSTIQLPPTAKGMFYVEIVTTSQKFIRKIVVL